MAARDLAHDGEAETAARRVLAPLAEPFEDHASQSGPDTRSLVGHLDHDKRLAATGRDAPEKTDRAKAMCERVVEQVAHSIAEIVGAAPHWESVGKLDHKCATHRLGEWDRRCGRLAGDAGEIDHGEVRRG